MTLTIALPPDEENKLAQRAKASGQEIGAYVRQLIRKDIEQLSFAELFAPVHEAVRQSGISDAELDSVLQSSINESRAARRSKGS